MGTVYLAWELALEREVAMKFLQRPGNHAAYDRFLVEVRALAQLDHPHIIRVLASDFLRADPFFTTEYVSGGSLSKKVEADGPLDPAEAARVMARAARAIHAANVAQVIHRDLKPSNILLAADGSPRIADFGLAKRLDRDDGLTTSPGPLGTPRYMAPEQTGQGDGTTDARTDVYGLGATLYYLLTGQPPFTGTTEKSIRQIQNDPPVAPCAIRSTIPYQLEAIVLKCLEKHPRQRYQTAEALAQDLDRFLTGKRPLAPPLTTWRRLRRWVQHRPAAATGTVLFPAFIAAALFISPSRPDSHSVESQDPPPPRVAIPAPSDEAVQEMQEELRRGRAVTLIGADGVPRWHRWKLGAGSLTTSNAADPTAAVWSRWDECLLELLPDPGIESYRISARIVLERYLSPVTTRERVGIYFAGDRKTAADGTIVHSLPMVAYTDGGAGSPPAVACWYRLVTERRSGFLPFKNLIGQDPAPIAVPPSSTPVRTFEIEVMPNRVKASIDGRAFAIADADRLRDLTASIQAETNKQLPDGSVRLAGWSPRGSLGIWVSGAQARVQNLVITPLP